MGIARPRASLTARPDSTDPGGVAAFQISGGIMYRTILRVVATVLVATAVQPAAADDARVCGQAAGDDAIAACTRLLSLNPSNVVAYVNRGLAYASKKAYDRAISEFDQAIRIDPKYVMAYNNRGLTYRIKGDYDRALADYDHAIRLDPGHASTYNNRGFVYRTRGDYDRAIADFDQAIRIDAKLASSYHNRGLAYDSRGDYDRAISDFDRTIQLDPTDAVAHSHRGSAYNHKGDYDHAVADFNQALRLNPSLLEAQQGLERVRVLLAKRPGPAPQAGTAGAAAAVPVAIPDPPAGTAATPLPSAGRRIALVIGMSAYANVAPLRNPVSDARAVADAFRRLGFAEVIEREDLTRAKLEEVLKGFGDKAAEADWAVIYYAGHGIEMKGENYLVPVDAELTRAEHVEDEAVTLTRVLSKAEPARTLRMVILDACRNNPFRLASADGRTRAIGRGLSPVEPAGGVLVAYAARGGTLADDGNGEHSPFTQALLANLETPGLEVSLLFRKVRDQVRARTNSAQEPFIYGSLPGEELYFRQPAR